MTKDNLLKDLLENSEKGHLFRNDLRSKFSNELGPHMMELIRTTEQEFSKLDKLSNENRIVVVMLMAEAMGDMLAQLAIKIFRADAQETLFLGLVEQLKLCGLDFLERNG